jgi:group I intron endonuclease
MPKVHRGKSKAGWNRRKRHSGIYSITNKITGEIYLGRSVDIMGRWNTHITQLFAGTHHNKNLLKDFEQHNYRDYKFEIVELCSKAQTRQRERELIREFKEKGEKLFNSNEGG